jgi:hypothetical protein
METFATEHPQINAVLRGDFTDVDRTKNPSGGYLVYEVVSVNPAGDSGITYAIDVLICENVTEINNESNTLFAQNECSFIGLDLLAVLENYNAISWVDKDVIVELQKNWAMQPFEQRFDSLYSGIQMNMNITTGYSYARCKVPVTPPNAGIGFMTIGTTLIVA